MMKGIRSCLRWLADGPSMRPGDLFPSIDSEIGRHREILKGRVLNAGAGDRVISHLVQGELFNQDIPHGQHNANIHIHSPLHNIPKPDGFFDAIVCNAVLEHVANPEEVMAEFARVCRSGGSLYLAVPFLQPEHKDPTDFQRYTADGLSALAERHGFSVASVEPLFSIYTTLGWIVWCWLESRRSARNSALKWVLYPLLRKLARTSKEQVPAAASCYRVIARRV
jgi:SAM-dependent methyltransferase